MTNRRRPERPTPRTDAPERAPHGAGSAPGAPAAPAGPRTATASGPPETPSRRTGPAPTVLRTTGGVRITEEDPAHDRSVEAGAPDDGPWIFEAPRDRTAPGRPATGGRARDGRLPDAVLFDRDGTLIVDVPYNGDPRRVRPLPGAGEATALLRSLGVPTGVVSNQSGVARGLLTRRQVASVRERVDRLLGPFPVWAVCPHGPDDGCPCRKPAPGLVLAACARLGARPSRTVVIGDIGGDMAAARAAGAEGVLVPTAATLPDEIAAAPRTAPDLMTAVRLALTALPPDGAA
ncbi:MULTISPECIES: D-glycero-alpha-D-manno-heptose-1,7-bisphosphate 7-phosphatase [unclassified Streptomyces]|uniref:D-glycero-alpha-D-manno-heptose-1,7-bisphosphate 7-phosphatase n=1 Tax=unclassified Streptomyces TaxID=2593676 RepID=UPI0036A96C3C